jgi:DNA helicase-2/ATP-dependent DNA helicase PcrA
VSIIRLANYLVDWVRTEHPVVELRGALDLPHIAPTPPGDPQPNPEDTASSVHIHKERLSAESELRLVVRSAERWLDENRDRTVAILVPRNDRGFAFARALEARNIPFVEFLRSTQSTRQTAGALGNVFRHLADPTSPRRLARLFEVWRRDERDDDAAASRVQAVSSAIAKIPRAEEFLWPRAERDWLAAQGEVEGDLGATGQLQAFRDLVRRWHEASDLPVDQLLLTVAQDLFDKAEDLAIAHKLASHLRRAQDSHPDWRLPELTRELAVIATNQRRFLGLSQDDSGFDPNAYAGRVVVTTAHKAKGLEWDRVYLTAVNNYNFPSAMAHDDFMSERWFVREQLNVEEEALAQLSALIHDVPYEEGAASREARIEYASERLRLLYVGITRARRELILTTNTGRGGRYQPAAPFVALSEFWGSVQECEV